MKKFIRMPVYKRNPNAGFMEEVVTFDRMGIYKRIKKNKDGSCEYQLVEADNEKD